MIRDMFIEALKLPFYLATPVAIALLFMALR